MWLAQPRPTAYQHCAMPLRPEMPRWCSVCETPAQFRLDAPICRTFRCGFTREASYMEIGVSAVALPTHVAGSLPQGVQVIASFYREDLCLEAAAAIEARLGTFTPINPACPSPRASC